MKKLIILWTVAICIPLFSFSDDPDPVHIRTGEQFYFNTFQNYGWGCSSNLFKDNDGNLHGAYVDNFKLYYLFSEDNGETWETEQVITGFEGKIWNSGIVVNSEGAIFIPFAMHPNYNYGQSALSSSQFIYKIYCAIFSGENWEIVLLQDNIPGSNQGHRLGDVLIDSDDRVHVFTERYGWYTYGGSLFEIIYDPAEKSWEIKTIVSYSDTPIDNFSLITKAAINSEGDIAIMFWRHYFNRWQYAIKPVGGEWPTPEVFDTNPAFRQFSLAAGPDGGFHIAWVKGSDPFTLRYKHGFDNPEPITLYTGITGETLAPVIHADKAGKLTLIIGRNIPNIPLIKVKPSAEEDWADDLAEFPFDETVTGLYNVKLQQGLQSHYQTLFFKYFRGSGNGPHGPDEVYFWQSYNLKELTLEAEPPEGGSVSGEGFYNIDSPVSIKATPEEGYIFIRWEDEDGVVFSSESSYDFNMPLKNTTLTAIFQSTASVDEEGIKPPVKVYPNPSPDGIFSIVADRELRLRVVNMLGKTVATQRLRTGNNELNLSGKPAGIYALEFYGDNVNIVFRVMIR